MSSQWRPRLEDDNATAGPVYLAIANALERDVKGGRLPAGYQLPTQRELATALGVDLTTVSRAYREGRSRGLIAGIAGKGTFVSDDAVQSKSRAASIDMTMNHPPITPVLEHRLREAVGELRNLVDAEVPSAYGPHAGTMGDRAIGARWVSQRLPACDVNKLVISSGVQGALQLFCLTVVGPGGTLLTENMTYPGIKSIAAHLGIELVGLAMDEEGLVPDALQRALMHTGAKAVYCTPTLHNPTTATMSEQRRKDIACLLATHNALLLEDDVYGLLMEEAAAPIAAYAPEHTFYATSLSKVVAPALRAGYLVAPTARWFAELEAASRAVVYSVSPFNTLVMRALTVGGHLDEIVSSIREEARRRQAFATRTLPKSLYTAHPDSHHGWLELPAGWTGAAFAAQARQSDIVLASSETFAVGDDVSTSSSVRDDLSTSSSVRLSLGSASDQAHLESALTALRDALMFEPGKAIISG